MYRLTYISTARPGLADSELARILATARRRNAAEAISGLLVHDGVRFLQYLEGPRSAVEAAFGRIADDDRHHACHVLATGEGDERQFGQWDMASRQLVSGEDMAGLVDQVKAAVAGCDALTAARLVGFARVRG